MRKTPLKKVSKKQEDELAKRRGLRYQLWREQEGKCAKCGRLLYWNQTELSHKIPRGRGGKTTKKNCEVTCAWWLAGCHPEAHGLRNIYNEKPQWNRTNRLGEI